MPRWGDWVGTSFNSFRLGLSAGVRLVANAGILRVMDDAGAAEVPIQTARLDVSGNQIRLNYDGAGAGDRVLILARPSTQTADYTFTYPDNPGTNGMILSTLGDGRTNWVPVGSTADKISTDFTAIAFGSSSTISMFTLPENATVLTVEVIVDTPFNNAATVSVGIAGNTSKYLAANQCDLKAVATSSFEVGPNIAPVANSEAIIATYASGGATAGAARIFVRYAIPT